MSGPTDIAGKIKDVTAALAKADAELKWEMAATAADVAGMVDPTPVSDLVGAGLSLRKGDFLGAGLSVASMVPYVGDALAKPVKAVRATKAVIAIEKKIAGLTKTLNGLRKAEKEAQAVEAAAKEAKAASEAAAKAKPPKSKEAAEQQQAAANDGKPKDCEDCSAGGGGKKSGANGAAPSALKNGEFTPIRFGDDGQVYAKLPAPSNPDVMRWQRMNDDGMSNRNTFMGSTPSRDSTVGLQVQDRMRQSGALTGEGTDRLVLGSDGNWHPIGQTDMGHVQAAVDFWNSKGRYYGPRAPEVRTFMNDPTNYWLEPSSINRSNGASMGKTYMQPATQAEKNQFSSIFDIE